MRQHTLLEQEFGLPNASPATHDHRRRTRLGPPCRLRNLTNFAAIDLRTRRLRLQQRRQVNKYFSSDDEPTFAIHTHLPFPSLDHEASHAIDIVENRENFDTKLVQGWLGTSRSAIQSSKETDSVTQKRDVRSVNNVDPVPVVNYGLSNKPRQAHTQDRLTKQVMQSTSISPCAYTTVSGSTNKAKQGSHARVTEAVLPSSLISSCVMPSIQATKRCVFAYVDILTLVG